MSGARRESEDGDMRDDDGTTGDLPHGGAANGADAHDAGRHRTAWHPPEEDLAAYERGTLAPPRLWSADTHLTACAPCRAALAALGDPAALDAGWERLDAELDAPRPGRVEALLVRIGVADHTARLLASAPVLRRSWLGAVAAVLAMTVAAANAVRAGATPTLFLALAPLLPLAGVALSYGPRLDPTYEMAVVSPLHGFRLLMIRTVAVLTVGLGLNGAATLALPSYGLRALAWLLPALALTASGLALASRIGPVLAPALVAGGWVAVLAVAGASTASGGTLAPFTPAGQAVAGAVAVLAAALLYLARERFDAARLPFTDLTDRNSA
ncbi:zf-HC2 domain-containing protein [Streptomyces sp. NPDC048566]|uniref:zf-HC2 domain-containing protein n=1 Tax=Streptomyces sp. NPDC048566 TaxID=3365569 RepID=UPI00371A48D1